MLYNSIYKPTSHSHTTSILHRLSRSIILCFYHPIPFQFILSPPFFLTLIPCLLSSFLFLMLHHHLLLLSLILFLFSFTSSSVTVILLSSFLPKLLFLFFIKRYLFCHLRLVLSNCTFPSYYPTKGLIWLPMSSIPCVLHVTLVSSSLHLEKCKRIKFGTKISR